MKTFTSGSAAVQLRKMNTELKICWNCTWEADEAVILRCLIVVSSVAQKYRGWLGPRTMEEPVYFNIIQGCFAVIFAIAPRRRKDARCPNQVRDAYFLSLWKFHCTIIGIIDHLEFKKDAQISSSSRLTKQLRNPIELLSFLVVTLSPLDQSMPCIELCRCFRACFPHPRFLVQNASASVWQDGQGERQTCFLS